MAKTRQSKAIEAERIAVPETARLKFRDINKPQSDEVEQTSTPTSKNVVEITDKPHRMYYNPNNLRR